MGRVVEDAIREGEVASLNPTGRVTHDFMQKKMRYWLVGLPHHKNLFYLFFETSFIFSGQAFP
jgi:hypothetical protein